jgi:translation initiation factor eIF-2B subunit beta
MELAIGNMVRRVLFIIREEFANRLSKNESGDTAISMAPSLGGMLASPSMEEADFTAKVDGVKEEIMSSVNETIEELNTVHDSISEQATEHISEHAVLLTCGESRSVEMFIKSAAKKRHFQVCVFGRNFSLSLSLWLPCPAAGQTHTRGAGAKVFVAETEPYGSGQRMAKRLADGGIDTTLITDAAVFAVMSKVDKVLLPTHTVMANGGLIASSGSHNVALAARTHAVPVLCVTGLFKLCPLYPHDLDKFNELTSPSTVLNFESEQGLPTDVEVLNPAYDYIPPELIALYVTNTGGHQPSYIYRLLAECYHHDDYDLTQTPLDLV